MGRPFDQHIDNRELNALVPSSSENGHRLPALSADEVGEAERHVRSCKDCSTKVSKYRQFLNMASTVAASDGASPGAGCPHEDVDWLEVTTRQSPELKAKQLIMHAALCDHCGPLLRAAMSVDDEPTAEEEEMLEQLAAPSRPVEQASRNPLPQPGPPSVWRSFKSWNVFVPAAALILLVGILIGLARLSSGTISGTKYAEIAVATHRQHVEGKLSLEVHSTSQQTINEWFKTNSRFPLALPASPATPGEARPFRLEGARIVKVAGKPAAFIAYDVWTPKLQMTPASLIVTRDSVAVASGGMQVNFNKVSFHYATVQGYKVVTWSMHGLTYALVSQETTTQGSCMVCHSALRDRDLSHTQTPLHTSQDPSKSISE